MKIYLTLLVILGGPSEVNSGQAVYLTSPWTVPRPTVQALAVEVSSGPLCVLMLVFRLVDA